MVSVEGSNSFRNCVIKNVIYCQKPKRRIPIEEVSEDESDGEDIPHKVVQTNVKGASSQKVLDQDAKKFDQFLLNGHDEKNYSTQVVDNSDEKQIGSKQVKCPEVKKQLTVGDSCIKEQKDKQSDVNTGMASIPTTSYQFQAGWKKVKNDPEKFFHYFKVN